MHRGCGYKRVSPEHLLPLLDPPLPRAPPRHSRSPSPALFLSPRPKCRRRPPLGIGHRDRSLLPLLCWPPGGAPQGHGATPTPLFLPPSISGAAPSRPDAAADASAAGAPAPPGQLGGQGWARLAPLGPPVRRAPPGTAGAAGERRRRRPCLLLCVGRGENDEPDRRAPPVSATGPVGEADGWPPPLSGNGNGAVRLPRAEAHRQKPPSTSPPPSRR